MSKIEEARFATAVSWSNIVVALSLAILLRCSACRNTTYLLMVGLMHAFVNPLAGPHQSRVALALCALQCET